MEKEFLKNFHWLSQVSEYFEPSQLFSHEGLTTEECDKICKQLESLNMVDDMVSCPPEIDLNQLIPFIKRLLVAFPNLSTATEKFLTPTDIRRRVYHNASVNYSRQIEPIANHFEKRVPEDFVSFLNGDIQNLLIKTKDCDIITALYHGYLLIQETTSLVLTLKTLHILNKSFTLASILDQLYKVLLINCESSCIDDIAEVVFNVSKSVKVIMILSDDATVQSIRDRATNINYKEHEGIKWKDLTFKAKKTLLSNKNITFQNQETKVNLEFFYGEVSTVDQFVAFQHAFDSHTLHRMLKGEDLSIGKGLPGLGDIVDYYIPRSFIIDIEVNLEILANLPEDDIVSLAGLSREKIRSLDLHNDRIYFLKKGVRNTIHVHNGSKRTLEEMMNCNQHWMFLRDGRLYWQHTKGDVSTVKKYLVINACQSSNPFDDCEHERTVLLYTEEGLLDLMSDKRTLVISDTAGMGKSTVVNSLALKIKSKFPNVWVILINLNDCTTVFKHAKQTRFGRNDATKAVHFLIEDILPSSEWTALESSLDKLVLKDALLKRGKVVVICDGFDEICPGYETIVSQWLSALQQTRVANIFVTTRPNAKDILEDTLGTFAHSMWKFTEENQKDYLTKFWSKNLHDTSLEQLQVVADNWVRKLSESISDIERDFTGVPLQCRLLGEYLLDKLGSKEDMEPQYLSLLDLYQEFVDKKLKIYNVEKGIDDDSKTAEKISKIAGGRLRWLHWKYSLQLLLSENSFRQLYFAELDDDERRYLEVEILIAGLVQRRGENVQFIHRTFADFFALDYFNFLRKDATRKMHAKNILTSEFLQNPFLQVVRAFLNGLFRKSKAEDLSCLVQKYVDKAIANLYVNQNHETSLHVLTTENHEPLLSTFIFYLNKLNDENKVTLYARKMGKPGRSASHYAAWRGNGVAVMALHKYMDINDRTEDGLTLLYAASINGHIELALRLIEKGCDVNATNCKGETALFIASENGRLSMVFSLLSHKADVNLSSHTGATPLYVAAQNGHIDVVLALIGKGADVNTSKQNGNTPLHIASENGHNPVVSALIEHGAHLNSTNNKKRTALFLASLHGHYNIVNELIKNGADIAILDLYGYSSLSSCCVNGHTEIATLLLSVLQDNDGANYEDIGSNALFVASYYGHRDLAELLVKRGFDVNPKAVAKNPLLAAALNGHNEVALYLLQNGADMNVVTPAGHSLLRTAIDKELEGLAVALIEKGANVNEAFSSSQGQGPLLHQATEEGFLSVVTSLVDHGADLEATNIDGLTALFSACFHGYDDIATTLIEKGANVNAHDKGYSPLHLASQNGHLDVVLTLILNGATVNASDENGMRPLHMAAKYGRHDIVQVLVAEGADVNAAMWDGTPPLTLASENGQLTVVSSLIQLNADINARDNDGHSPLYLAAQHNRKDVAQFLIENGSTVDLPNFKKETPLLIAAARGHLDLVSLLIAYGADVNAQAHAGNTPVFMASQNNFPEVVCKLLEYDAIVNLPIKNGYTPLIIAAQNGSENMVHLLVASGADVNASTANGLTSLTVAAFGGFLTVAQVLLQNEARVNAQNVLSPLMVAASNGREDMVRLLIENGANVNEPDADGRTALYVAANCGYFTIFKQLLDAGADVNARNSGGNTVLQTAAGQGQDDIVRYLLETGFNVNIVDGEGDTPLHEAVANGRSSTLRLLLKYGAAVNVTNMYGYTPLQQAEEKGNPDILDCFKDITRKQ